MQPNKMSPDVYLDSYLYMVKLGIRDTVKSLWFLLDTRAGLTWAQCQPCKSFHEQNDLIHNSRSLKSYKRLPCNDATYKSPFYCFKEGCFYSITYDDNSETKGVLSLETFTLLSPDENSQVSVQNIRFDCTFKSKDFFRRKTLLGLWD